MIDRLRVCALHTLLQNTCGLRFRPFLFYFLRLIFFPVGRCIINNNNNNNSNNNNNYYYYIITPVAVHRSRNTDFRAGHSWPRRARVVHWDYCYHFILWPPTTLYTFDFNMYLVYGIVFLEEFDRKLTIIIMIKYLIGYIYIYIYIT